MTDRRKGDHYIEFLMASREVDELQRMLTSVTALDPLADISHASISLSQALQRKKEAIVNYNNMVMEMKVHIDQAKVEAKGGRISTTLYHMVCLLENAFNTELLEDNES